MREKIKKEGGWGKGGQGAMGEGYVMRLQESQCVI